MNKAITILIMVVCIVLVSCQKSDQEKAKEFIKNLDSNTKILLTLPPSSPKCIFYAEDNLIKCHSVETDSTTTIPYEDIDESTVSNVFAGKTNIMVITQDYDEIDGAYVYDVAKGKFAQIDPRGNGMKITDTKLSKSSQNITFTCDTIAGAPFILLTCMFNPSLDYETEKNKVGYYRTIKTYNFDGKLIKDKKVPISNNEWDEMESAKKESTSGNNSSTSSSSPAVYLWRCIKCDEEKEGVDKPNPHGCPWNSHMWEKVSRIR